MKKYIKTEGELQKYFTKELRAIGCLVYKFSSQGRRGVPDLLIIAPDGDVSFVELKAPTGKGRLSALQTITIEKMRSNNANVSVIDNKLACDNFVLVLECKAHA